jgi:hypothetical protein
METKEIQTLCLTRVPPGDSWREPNGDEVFDSLTAGLERIFQNTGCKEYRFSAAAGKIFTISTKEIAPPKPKTYSIYGDEY